MIINKYVLVYAVFQVLDECSSTSGHNNGENVEYVSLCMRCIGLYIDKLIESRFP